MFIDTEGLLGKLMKIALGRISRKAESHLLKGVLQYMTSVLTVAPSDLHELKSQFKQIQN